MGKAYELDVSLENDVFEIQQIGWEDGNPIQRKISISKTQIDWLHSEFQELIRFDDHPDFPALPRDFTLDANCTFDARSGGGNMVIVRQHHGPGKIQESYLSTGEAASLVEALRDASDSSRKPEPVSTAPR